MTIHRLLSNFASETVGSREFTCRPDSLARYGFGDAPLFHVLLLEVTSLAAGLAVYFAEFSTFRGRPGIYLQDLYVANPYRGRGFGRALLEAVIHDGRAWEAGYLRLAVNVDNDNAIAFYRKLGCRQEAEDQAFCIEGQPFDRLLAKT